MTADIPPHRLADLFPLLGGDEFARLVDDVRESGLLEPIVLHDGQVLDGRNRLRACRAAGVEPRFVVFTGEDPVSYVISRNIARRHLTPTQRALVAQRLLPGLRREAEERRLRGCASRGAEVGRATEKAARICGVGGKTVERVARVLRDAPELEPALASGELTAKAAEIQVRRRERLRNGTGEPSQFVWDPGLKRAPKVAASMRAVNFLHAVLGYVARDFRCVEGREGQEAFARLREAFSSLERGISGGDR